jgi:hypothetical protein
MSTSIAQARFQVLVPGPTLAVDELGVWETAESAAHPGQATVWLIDLPADRELARRYCASKAAQLAVAERALPEASRRLRDFVRQGRSEELSFAVRGGSGVQTQPERNLAAWIRLDSGVDTHGEESFGMLDRLPRGWQETAERLQDLFDRVRDSFVYFARVQSMRAGRRLASTDVGWNGSFRTTWVTPVTADAAGQHAENLRLALRTRAAWLRMALLITRGALQLGLLLPTNPLLALPAAWQFFRDIIRLTQQLNAAQTHVADRT